jgi:hypothetical protein
MRQRLENGAVAARINTIHAIAMAFEMHISEMLKGL